MSLLLTPGSFFGLEAGLVQGWQAYGVQPNTRQDAVGMVWFNYHAGLPVGSSGSGTHKSGCKPWYPYLPALWDLE